MRGVQPAPSRRPWWYRLPFAALLAGALVASGCSMHRGFQWVKQGQEREATVVSERYVAEARLVGGHVATLQVWATQQVETRLVEVWKQLETRKKLTWFWVVGGIVTGFLALLIVLIVAAASSGGSGGGSGSSWDWDD